MSPEIERETAQMLCDENMALRAERDALRAEVERLKQAERWARAEVESLRIIMSLGRFARLLRAAQSLHRAWKRERRAHLEQRGERIEWVINYERVAAENNRMRADVASMATALCRSDLRNGLLTRLLRACQSLHRAWRRESAEVERLESALVEQERRANKFHEQAEASAVETTELRRAICGAMDFSLAHGMPSDSNIVHVAAGLNARCNEMDDAFLQGAPHQGDGCPTEHDAGCNCTVETLVHNIRRAERAEESLARLWAFVSAVRADGLDIDDPATAPTWTGKIHVGGRLVFDLATVGEPEPPSEPAPPLCTWCGKPVETGKNMRVTRTDAAGVAHTFHGACWSAHGEWVEVLPKP